MNRISRLLTLIDDFDARCADEEHTDVGDAWDLFNEIRNELREMKPTGQRGAVTVTQRQGESAFLRLASGDVIEVCMSSIARGRHRITIVADKSIKIDRTRK